MIKKVHDANEIIKIQKKVIQYKIIWKKIIFALCEKNYLMIIYYSLYWIKCFGFNLSYCCEWWIRALKTSKTEAQEQRDSLNILMRMKKLVTMVTTVNVKFTTENLVQVHSVCFNFVVVLFGLFVSFVFLTYRPRLPLFCDFTPQKTATYTLTVV